jgi:hypothetical protein
MGNAKTPPSTSTGVSVTIAKATTSLHLSCPSSVAKGHSVTCAVTLTGFYGMVAGQKITITQISGSGKVTFSTCVLSALGTCSFKVHGTSTGSVEIKASYVGNSNNFASFKTYTIKVK